MLAIIIPYYKITFFEDTLKSLANQTNKKFNVYIGNDGSPQDPTSLLKKFEGKFSFQYKRFETNLGGTSLVKQWERCIDLVQNETWLMILGDDDYLSENVVANFYKYLDIFNTYTQLVRFASRIDRHELGVFSITYTHPEWEYAADGFYRKYKQLTMSSLSEYIFSRSSYHLYGFCDFPLAWYADDMAWLQFSAKQPIYSINDAVVFFRHSNSNISGKIDNLELKEKAQYLFYKTLVSKELYLFDREQKITLLLTFGEICKAQGQLNFVNNFAIIKQLINQGAFKSTAKFIRRIYRAKRSFLC